MNLLGILDKWYFKQPLIRESVTRAVYGSRDVTVRMFGEEIVLNTLRENGYFRSAQFATKAALFRDEAGVLMNLTHFVRPTGHFVDVGANVGVFSSVFARFSRLYPAFQVSAFEAHPGTFSRLRLNAEKNGFSAHNFAVGEREQILEFVEGAVSHVTTTVDKANAYSKKGCTFTAECKMLDSFEWHSSDIILKIDVEGQEFEVLAGASGLLESGKVICVFIDGFEDARIPGRLTACGFKLYNARTLRSWEKATGCLLAIR